MDQTPTLRGVDNFRDFGGFAVAGGGTVRRGRLFRSAHHGQADDSDLEALAAIPVSVVVDLRRPTERPRAPSRRNGIFRPETIENEEGDGEAPHIAFLRRGDVSPQ